MYGCNLTREQYDAINRLFSSLDHHSSVSGVKLGSIVTGRGQKFLTVEFLSGRGNRAFHVDTNGDSAPVEADGFSSDLVRS